jgi:hypothetical protein
VPRSAKTNPQGVARLRLRRLPFADRKDKKINGTLCLFSQPVKEPEVHGEPKCSEENNPVRKTILKVARYSPETAWGKELEIRAAQTKSPGARVRKLFRAVE